MDPEYLVNTAIRPQVRQPSDRGLKHDIGTNVYSLFFRLAFSSVIPCTGISQWGPEANRTSPSSAKLKNA
jgi:hypothetical protein